MNHSWTKILPPFIRSKLDGRVILQKTIVNTGWLFIDQVIRLCMGMFVGVLFARYLGPEEFGIFNYAFAFFMIFSAIATLGLDPIVVREILKNPKDTNEILGTTFAVKLIFGILTLLLSIILISLIRPGDTLIHWLVGVMSAGIVFQAFDTIIFLFQSKIQSKYVVLAKGVAFFVSSVIRLVLIFTRATLMSFAWVTLAELILGALGLVYVFFVKGNEHVRWRISSSRAIEFLKDSWPLILASIIIMVYMRIDQIMIGEMIGNDAVGIYSAALRLSEVWYFLPAVIVSSVFPSIVDAKNINEKLYNDRMQQLYFLMSWIAITISIPLSLFSDTVIYILYGVDYANAGAILSIHIWSCVFVNLWIASSQYLLAENDTLVALTRAVTGAVIKVGANIIFIPIFGIKGAAVASVISYFCATFVVALNSKMRQQSIMMFKSLLLIPIKKL